jgi:predicted PurR-regulated permease PerM
MVTLRVPAWLQTLGRGSWLILGLVGVIAVALLLLGVISSLMIPLVVAAVVAAIVVPLVDVLERWHVRRWLGSALVLLLGLAIVAGITAMVVSGIIDQSDEIAAQAGAASHRAANAAPSIAGGDQLPHAVRSTLRTMLFGILNQVLGSVIGFVVGLVMGIFILLFLLKDWSAIVGWAGRHAGLPEPMGARLVHNAIEAFRAYARGLTIIGIANALIIGVGMLAIGVPLPATIAVVTFVGSYVPYLGAFVSGAFAVVIAYGEGGLGIALVALAIVLLAQNTLQNLLEPKAFGSQLRLHPLVVLLVVSGGTLLFGVFGAILAAPLTSVAVRTAADFRAAAIAADLQN